jgi:hypothetical protein
VVNRRLTSIADNLGAFLKKTAQTLDVSGRVGRAIKFAMAQLGEPYLWGGTGPDRWDCSGLMLRAFQAAGIRLPRVSRDQARAGVGVPGLGAALPGDMVFYGSPVHHVGMYLGRGPQGPCPPHRRRRVGERGRHCPRAHPYGRPALWPARHHGRAPPRGHHPRSWGTTRRMATGLPTRWRG